MKVGGYFFLDHPVYMLCMYVCCVCIYFFMYFCYIFRYIFGYIFRDIQGGPKKSNPLPSLCNNGLNFKVTVSKLGTHKIWPICKNSTSYILFLTKNDDLWANQKILVEKTGVGDFVILSLFIYAVTTLMILTLHTFLSTGECCLHLRMKLISKGMFQDILLHLMH